MWNGTIRNSLSSDNSDNVRTCIKGWHLTCILDIVVTRERKLWNLSYPLMVVWYKYVICVCPAINDAWLFFTGDTLTRQRGEVLRIMHEQPQPFMHTIGLQNGEFANHDNQDASWAVNFTERSGGNDDHFNLLPGSVADAVFDTKGERGHQLLLWLLRVWSWLLKWTSQVWQPRVPVPVSKY